MIGTMRLRVLTEEVWGAGWGGAGWRVCESWMLGARGAGGGAELGVCVWQGLEVEERRARGADGERAGGGRGVWVCVGVGGGERHRRLEVMQNEHGAEDGVACKQ